MMMLYPWQENDWSNISQDFGRLPNAWLFEGRASIGKAHFAKAVAQALLCQKPLDTQKACGVCSACHLFKVDNHPDFYPILPDSKDPNLTTSKAPLIRLEAIASMASFAALSSHQLALRIVLIDQADKMTLSAANALLKTLEEPPEHLLFLLVTTQKKRLLPTIKSRCRLFPLQAPSLEASLDWLEKAGAQNPQSFLFLQGGSPLASETLKYQSGWEVLMASLAQPNLSSLMACAEKIDQAKTPLSLVIEWLMKWLFDVIFYSLSGKAYFFLHQKPTLEKITPFLDLNQAFACFEALKELKKAEVFHLNARLQIETLLIHYHECFKK